MLSKFSFLIFLLLLVSCSFNQAIFDTSVVGEPIPDTVDFKEINIKNPQGKNIQAFLFSSIGEVKGSVFMLTGQSGETRLWYDAIDVLLRNGFQVFVFDYEGFGNSEGKPTHGNLLRDGQLMLDNFKKMKEIEGAKKILWGFSLGANLGVKLAYDNPRVFDYIILDSPYTSQRAAALHLSPFFVKGFAYPLASSPYASKKIINKITHTPILIVHSLEDQVSPYTEGEKLFELANNPKIFFESLGPHCFSIIDHEELYMERVNKLLRY